MDSITYCRPENMVSISVSLVIGMEGSGTSFWNWEYLWRTPDLYKAAWFRSRKPPPNLLLAPVDVIPLLPQPKNLDQRDHVLEKPLPI